MQKHQLIKKQSAVIQRCCIFTAVQSEDLLGLNVSFQVNTEHQILQNSVESDCLGTLLAGSTRKITLGLWCLVNFILPTILMLRLGKLLSVLLWWDVVSSRGFTGVVGLVGIGIRLFELSQGEHAMLPALYSCSSVYTSFLKTKDNLDIWGSYHTLGPIKRKCGSFQASYGGVWLVTKATEPADQYSIGMVLLILSLAICNDNLQCSFFTWYQMQVLISSLTNIPNWRLGNPIFSLCQILKTSLIFLMQFRHSILL